MLKFIKALFLNDRFILAIILINTLTIFGDGFQNLGSDLEKAILLVDSLVTILFGIEAGIKIRHHGWQGYIGDNWNKLDFILVVLSLPSLLLTLFPVGYVNLSFLLMFRISRVFKFFRFFRFIEGIDQLLSGVARALRASVLVLVAFFIYNFVFSLLSCYIYRDISPEHFGNPLTAFYSTFKIFTIEGWYEIPDSIVQDISPGLSFLTRIYFIVMVLTGGIFGLSLVNSVFVDSMVSDNNAGLEKRVEDINAKMDSLLKMLSEIKPNQEKDQA